MKTTTKLAVMLCMPLLVFCLGADGGCENSNATFKDPSQDDLKKGENIDIVRMTGVVISKEVNYYVGDRTETKEKIGKPYYTIGIRRDVQNTQAPAELFHGVTPEVFDSLNIDQTLPTDRIYTLEEVVRLEGKIVDKIVDGNEWGIVINQGLRNYRYFRLTPSAFYDERIGVGAELPLRIE